LPPRHSPNSPGATNLLTGNDDVYKLSTNDLCTTNSEISNHTEGSTAGRLLPVTVRETG